MNAAVPIDNPRLRWSGWLWALTLTGVWFWTFRSMSLWWSYAPAYEFAFVVPWIALFFAWQRVRRTPDCLEPPPHRFTSIAGVLVPALAWVIFLLGELLRRIDPMWRPVNWVFACAATLLTLAWAHHRGGWKLVGALAFPVFFAWTAVPWPGFFDDPLTMGLRDVVTVLTVKTLHAVGISAVQEVNVIQLSNGPVGVEDACSGIVSFHSSLMVALFLGEFMRLGWLRRVGLVAGASVLAVGGNLLRTFTLCWLVQREGMPAVAAYHDRLGLLSSGAIFGCVLVLAWLLKRWNAKEPQALAPPDFGWKVFADAPAGSRSAGLALIAFAAVPLLGLGWFAVRPSGGEQVQEAPLWAMRPQSVPAGWQVAPVEILPSQKATLGFTVGEAFAMQHPSSGSLQVFHFFWGAERSGLPYAHTPDICMSYIGWKQPGPARNVTLRLRGTDYLARSFRFERDGQEISALHTFWRGGEPGLTGNEFLDNRKLARLPLLFAGARLFGMEELLIFVSAPGDEETRLRLAGEILSQMMTRTDAPSPAATAAR